MGPLHYKNSTNSYSIVPIELHYRECCHFVRHGFRRAPTFHGPVARGWNNGGGRRGSMLVLLNMAILFWPNLCDACWLVWGYKM
uniref:Uncharacterized protein n=1 Tax=Picea glauca TaxID=3330 RepID=A0A101LY97_PICGL|nr:hypothetical protein ABT39_MTgene5765 [Picea glauca]QHR90462.1 hypothetical protein Q903MT_gene4486 [Picea sitchensis]